jgi:hypothetical protein
MIDVLVKKTYLSKTHITSIVDFYDEMGSVITKGFELELPELYKVKIFKELNFSINKSIIIERDLICDKDPLISDNYNIYPIQTIYHEYMGMSKVIYPSHIINLIINFIPPYLRNKISFEFLNIISKLNYINNNYSDAPKDFILCQLASDKYNLDKISPQMDNIILPIDVYGTDIERYYELFIEQIGPEYHIPLLLENIMPSYYQEDVFNDMIIKHTGILTNKNIDIKKLKKFNINKYTPYITEFKLFNVNDKEYSESNEIKIIKAKFYNLLVSLNNFIFRDIKIQYDAIKNIVSIDYLRDIFGRILVDDRVKVNNINYNFYSDEYNYNYDTDENSLIEYHIFLIKSAIDIKEIEIILKEKIYSLDLLLNSGGDLYIVIETKDNKYNIYIDCILSQLATHNICIN